jgi:G8 domain
MIRSSHRYLFTLLVLAACLLAGPLFPGDQAPADTLGAAASATDGSANGAGNFPDSCALQRLRSIEKCTDDKGDVTIGNGAIAGCTGAVGISAGSVKVGKITINAGGSLSISDGDAKTFKPIIETDGIDINGGSLLIGAPDCPIGTMHPADKFTFLFAGPKPTTCGTPNNKPDSQCPGWQKGIQVEAKGTLRMYGAAGVVPAGVSWTYLSKPAGPDRYNASKDDYIKSVLAPVTDPPHVIHVAADVTKTPENTHVEWHTGDWIAIATTSFSPWETEFVRIAKLEKESTGTKITLDQKLQYYHFGGPDPGVPGSANYNADAKLNYGVDERAEVGLISRNIVLTSDTDTKLAKQQLESTHWGGEIRILRNFTAVAIQGVELQKFSKEQLGSYPIHFHRDGDLTNYAAADKLIDSNSIDHSYNKCITVHSTQHLTLSNNVCARITGHIFYEEYGDESDITFNNNLGMGAMSDSFDVNAKTSDDRSDLIKAYYWVGDHMAKPEGRETMSPDNIGFNQFNIFDTDAQDNPVHGQCGTVNAQGKINFDSNSLIPNCPSTKIYFEPPSGFWITNPSAKLTGNAIAGCQDIGKAYYYVPPGGPVTGTATVDPKWIPIGTQYGPTGKDYGANNYGVFQNNRGSACYQGLYDDPEGVTSDQIFPYQNAIHDAAHHPVVGEFDGLTLSRIRDRGIWLRPLFYVFENARIATIRDAVSLVTTGGVDGNYPGVWSLLKDSTVVGISQNNVDRWGPCGAKVLVSGAQVRGAEWGCIDQTNPQGTTATGGEFTERGYPSPDWPLFGFLIYDGPPLIIHDRFVNFTVSPGSVASDSEFPAANLLTGADDTILKNWIFYGIPGYPTPPPAYTKYEGDAALGWFNANQSSYPAATTTDKLAFTNVDLRHQVYTAQVNRGDFTDGDENTTILDLDGTLAGVLAKDTVTGQTLPSISLNNLGMNASANSVDECLAKGAEDKLLEGRPTAAMEPNALGQLEFEMLYPPYADDTSKHTETLTFAKDSPDFTGLSGFANYHGTMPLKSRDGKGDWEPKVTNGYGYTVTASTYTSTSGVVSPPSPTLPGIGNTVDITLTDIVNDPELSATHPFYVQLGICYTNKDTTHPPNNFTVTRGYRTYGASSSVISNDLLLNKYWTPIQCGNLDYLLVADKTNDMPTFCPGASATGSPIVTLSPVTSIAAMTTDGKLNGPPNLDNYFYDSTNGWLFLWVRQNEPNAQGPSPLGICTGASDDPPYCPSKTTGESYYVCPAQGCSSLRVVVNDPNYVPGTSACGDPYSSGEEYSWPAGPANQNTLVTAASTPVSVVQTPQGGKDNKFPHYASGTSLTCNVTQP